MLPSPLYRLLHLLGMQESEACHLCLRTMAYATPKTPVIRASSASLLSTHVAYALCEAPNTHTAEDVEQQHQQAS